MGQMGFSILGTGIPFLTALVQEPSKVIKYQKINVFLLT